MKNKKITKYISFLLALVLLFSFPLNTQAHAAVAAPWMIYALITYMAAVGITFTVSGGVDAMLDAVESAVKDYEQQNNIIDFYDIYRRNNLRFVPNNKKDPNGNPLFDLFFTASAVEATQRFLNWLTTEGGWNLGAEQTNSLSQSTFIASIKRGSSDMTDEVLATSVVDNGVMVEAGTLLELDWNTDNPYVISQPGNQGQIRVNIYYTNASTSFRGSSIQISKKSDGEVQLYRGNSISYIQYDVKDYLLSEQYSMTDISAIYFVDNVDPNKLGYGFLMNDGTCLTDTHAAHWLYVSDKVTLSSTIHIMTPEELQEQFPAVGQGISIQDAISVPMGDPSLIEWAERVEETFIETGTIPKPVPQVVPDPDVAPQPTAVPTPVPTPVPDPEIEDIDDLGLPTLGEAIFNKFPFSLPKDIGRIFGLLSAEPVTPYWTVDLTGSALGIPSNFEIDFAEYEMLGQISRWYSVISYCLFLILITRGMIKW